MSFGAARITIDELVTLVNVALEAIGSNQCVATDDRPVTIDLIIEAVGNALRGCPSGAARV